MKNLILILIFSVVVGCSQLTLEPSDFSWPIESVLEINDEGNVTENRYSFTTNVKSLFLIETNDSSSFVNSTVRIIRDEQGYYYLTANGFKNVYIFNVNDGKMILSQTILISEFGLDLPAFNQRKPYIEILDGEQHVMFINSNGIKEKE